MSELAARWRAIEARVATAAERAGRDPRDVTIVAVSKTHPAEAVVEAMAAGVAVCGENYVQELLAKQKALAALGSSLASASSPPLSPASSLAGQPRWHFIGRLQRNKVKQLLGAGPIELLHAVDSVELARELGKRTAPGGAQPFLLAVNLAGETTKSGVSDAGAAALAAELGAIPNLAWRGLMTMPPPSHDPEASRPVFAALAALRDRLQDQLGRALPYLSMGMSDDFEVAIACGATHVRIGTAIFGSRPRAIGDATDASTGASDDEVAAVGPTG